MFYCFILPTWNKVFFLLLSYYSYSYVNIYWSAMPIIVQNRPRVNWFLSQGLPNDEKYCFHTRIWDTSKKYRGAHQVLCM